MSGPTRGIAALVAAEYPLAIYIHLASHCLDLVVIKSLQVTCVRNLIGAIVGLLFAANPKRQAVLEMLLTIEETQPETQVHKLKDLCKICLVPVLMH